MDSQNVAVFCLCDDMLKALHHYQDPRCQMTDSEAGLRMKPIRKSNSKRPFPPWVFYLQSTYHKIVETTGSMNERLLPKSIHSVTAKGFELKVGLFVLAASLNFLWWQLG